ncbi:unnamed protein product [Callosobruchus maculatus]|uniref:DUF4774 domain-containing protein n=1 Tax=Callosobruchus maculatus TaxID=64391 RepID=A0A653DWR6_CALMS|nr:unnamed protein product [Callosobruchus maculatus]
MIEGVLLFSKFTHPLGLRFPKRLTYPSSAYAPQLFGNYLYNVDPTSNQLYYSFYPLQTSNLYYNFPKQYQHTREEPRRTTTPPPRIKQKNRAKPLKLSQLPTDVEEVDDMLSMIPPVQQVKVTNAQNKTSEALKQKKPPSLAAYRAHPLLHYVKNRNTIAKEKIISFRNPNSSKEDITTLILKPVARSVAGVEGKAVSNPLSKAILRDGVNVDILFEPDAVAIAGPGGVAHAQSDLEISYEDVI